MSPAKQVPLSPPKAVKAEPAPDRPPCLCGCGGFPKGPTARFVPGHDARYHAAQRKAAAEAAAVARPVTSEAKPRRQRASAPPPTPKGKEDASVALPEAVLA